MSEITHGTWKEKDTTKPHGITLGTATITVDSKTMSLIIESLRSRIGDYEKLKDSKREGLDADNERKFQQIKWLRDKVESTRDKTLKE